jgi:flagellar basal body-associated protein FliL
MPEDTNDNQSADDSSADGGETGALGKILKLLLPVGIIVVFATAGYFASGFGGPVEAGGAQDTEAATTQPAKASSEEDPDQTHYDLEPIIINLNEPQATRYLRVIFSLAINDDDYSTAEAAIIKKSYKINNYLLIYLSNLSLEEVRGAKNINRVRREVQDSLNDRLWPGEKPLIASVSLKEWIVQ